MIDYRRLSGKYIVNEYNSYNKVLIFTNHYENNKRNGKGKEFNENSQLIFDGEYLDGKKWKGKYYKYDRDTNNIILECECLNGVIDGEVKEFDKYNGKLMFSGKYKNGKRNAKE